jgi:hypothetical protein
MLAVLLARGPVAQVGHRCRGVKRDGTAELFGARRRWQQSAAGTEEARPQASIALDRGHGRRRPRRLDRPVVCWLAAGEGGKCGRGGRRCGLRRWTLATARCWTRACPRTWTAARTSWWSAAGSSPWPPRRAGLGAAGRGGPAGPPAPPAASRAAPWSRAAPAVGPARRRGPTGPRSGRVIHVRCRAMTAPTAVDGGCRARSHSDTWVGCIVSSTTASSSAVNVSRSTCWRSRWLNTEIVSAAS